MAHLQPVRLLKSVHQRLLFLQTVSPVIACRRALTHQKYRRPGQPIEDKFPWENINFDFKKGIEGIKKHFTLMHTELFERFVGPQGKPLVEHILEQNLVIWEFRGAESLKQWVVSSDQEIGGQSDVHLTLGRNNDTCLLYGTLSSVIPRDGETRYSGYCTLRSQQQLASFDRKKQYDWTTFNTLHLRVRGDGRPWMINIHPETYFSHNKDDIYSYFLYTRGGPYWQEVKVDYPFTHGHFSVFLQQIPFSKFFVAHKGRVQDSQHCLMLDKINTVGFTLGDNTDGPFQLEIDFIGVCKDEAHIEELAYESYEKNPQV